MKITILVNRDLPALLALNYLLPSLDKHQVSVFYTNKAPVKDLPTALQQLAKFERQLLLEIDNSDSDKKLLSLEQLGRYTCAGIVQLNAVNSIDFAKLQQSQPDLIVSIRHMTILHAAAINLPRLGAVNLHSGLLPSYQGVMSTFRAMGNKEAMVGSSLHFIEDQKIDSGAIIAQAQLAMHPNKSYFWNVLNLYRQGCQLIQNAVDCLASEETLASIPQDGLAYYYSYPKQQDLTEFAEKGFKLFEIDDLSDFERSLS
ncbi:MAG: methionyl-tRNA formyltransferase [Arenicella sp.]